MESSRRLLACALAAAIAACPLRESLAAAVLSEQLGAPVPVSGLALPVPSVGGTFRAPAMPRACVGSPVPASAIRPSRRRPPAARRSLHAAAARTAGLAKVRSCEGLRRAAGAFWDAGAGVGVLPVEASAEAAPLEVALERAAPGSRVPAAEPPPVQARRGVARQLWFWIIVALAAGGGAGFLAPAFPAAGTALQYAGTFGELFLKALRYLAGPLVFSSIISAVGGHEDPRELGSLSWKMLAYYLFTSAAACGIGLGVSALIEPGKYLVLSSLPSAGAASVAKGSVPTLGAFLSGLIPGDPITPFLTANTLQVVFMAVVAGASLLLARTFGPEKVRALAGKAASGASFAQEGVMRLVGFVMLSAPLAVFGLTGKLFSNGGLGALAGMGAYMGTVLLGLALLMVFYSALVKAFAGISPRRYLKGLRDPMLTGFSTASSSATMPVSLKAALKLGVSPPVANLMITLGAAINMEGTALYQSVAVMFLAQAFGVSLSPGSILFILAVLLASSLGTPGAPGAGMAILATVMGGVGIPLEGIALILGVDRILDMARTSANVAGDITSAVMMDELLKRGKARRLNARAEKP